MKREFLIPLENDITVWCFMSLTQFDALIELGYFYYQEEVIIGKTMKGEIVSSNDTYFFSSWIKSRTTLKKLRETYNPNSSVIVETSINKLSQCIQINDSIEKKNHDKLKVLFHDTDYDIQQKDLILLISGSNKNPEISFIITSPSSLIKNVYILNNQDFFLNHINSLLHPLNIRAKYIEV